MLGPRPRGTARRPQRHVQLRLRARNHSCAVRADGTLDCWGLDYSGLLDAPGGHFTAVSASPSHSCAIRTGGSLKCWGTFRPPPEGVTLVEPAGASDALGTASISGPGDTLILNPAASVRPSPTPGGGPYTSIDTSGLHTCALRTDGSLDCWGWSSHGEADPDPDKRYTAVTVGQDHSCGLRFGGTIDCWGAPTTTNSTIRPESSSACPRGETEPAHCARKVSCSAGEGAPLRPSGHLRGRSSPSRSATRTHARCIPTTRSSAGEESRPTSPKCRARTSP